MPKETSKKHCSSCETKYTVQWDIDEQDLETLTCPFCGHEVSDEEEIEEIWENTDTDTDDSWN